MVSETRFGETKQFIAAQVRGIRKCIKCSAYIVPKYDRSYLSPINLPNWQFLIQKVITVFRIEAANDG